MSKLKAVLFSVFLLIPSIGFAQEIDNAAEQLLGITGASIQSNTEGVTRKKGSVDYSGFWQGTFTPKKVKAKKGKYSSFTCRVTTRAFDSAFQVQQTGKRVTAQFASGFTMQGKAKKKMSLKGSSGGVGLKIAVSKSGKAKLLEIHKFDKGASCTIHYTGNLSHFPG